MQPGICLPKNSLAQLLPFFAGHLLGKINENGTGIVLCHASIRHYSGILSHGLFRYLAFTFDMLAGMVEAT